MHPFSPFSWLIHILLRGVAVDGDIGARRRFRGGQRNQPPVQAPPINQQQRQQNQPEFRDHSEILLDWRDVPGVVGAVISQKAAICWAIVMAKLMEAAYKISNIEDPTKFYEISYDYLVKKIKKKTKEMEIGSLKKCIKFIKNDGVAKRSTTSVQNDDLAKKIPWVFDSKEDADREFIQERLNIAPVGIIIGIDDEFGALREGIYKVKPPQINTRVRKHALMIIGHGRTQDGQRFFITQNSWDKIWGVNGFGRIAIEDDIRCLVFYPELP